MSGRALVIGESLVDMIGAEDPAGDIVYRPRSGGSPLNVAVGLARLGTDVTFATAIAADSFGRRLRSFLADERVDVISAPDERHGTCLAVATRFGENVEFEYFGDSATMLDIAAVSVDIVDASAVVHAGSTAFLGVPVLTTVVEAYGRPGPFRAADPNPRPFLIHDRHRYLERLEEAIALADLVKLSRDDTDYLYPDLRIEAVTDHLLALGAAIVIITGADRDTALATAAGLRWVSVPETDAVDPTGAGDSFSASILHDICTRGVPDDLDGWESLTWRADVAASLTCTVFGGAQAMPHAGQLTDRLRALGSTAD
jgi:fructokinase